MRILLDENLPWQLGPLLTGHSFRTVVAQGWGGVKNGRLLTLAQAEFDVFLTMDQGIPYQQNLTKFDLAVFLLRAPSNDIEDLKPLVPLIIQSVQSPKKKTVTLIKV